MQLPDFINAQLLVSIVVLVIVFHIVLGLGGYGTYLERKISAYIQDRIGPNRVGFDFGIPQLSFLKGLFGLGQPLADGLKMIMKEDFTPRGADKVLFTLAPIFTVVPALIAFAIIPWGGVLSLPASIDVFGLFTMKGGDVVVAGANLSVGVVYVLAVAGVGLYGIILGSWASNNKYAFLGGLRSSAQMISYEIPLGLSLLAALLLIGSLTPQKIVEFQAENGWLVLSQPLAAVLLFICALAEANRAPFDNAECEQELVGGYHTEYSAMRFGMMALTEYMHAANGAAFFVLVFLGGYHLPWISEHNLLSPESTSILAVLAKFHVFLAKVLVMIFLIMLVRWTIPRLRYDQVMRGAWQGAIPLSIAIVVVTAVMVHLGYDAWWQMALANVAVAAGALLVLSLAPASPANRRVRLSGSRFFGPEGEAVSTRPTDPNALADLPDSAAVTTR